MNKKFSTLLASVLLTSAFTVSAQVKEGDYVRLNNSTTNYIGIDIDPTSGMPTGKLTNVAVPTLAGTTVDDVQKEIKKTNSQIWKVAKVTTTSTGHKTYQFVNKLTGEYLALKLDVATNAKLDATGNRDWALTAESNGYLYAYDAAKDSTYYLTTGMALTRVKGLPATPGTMPVTLATTMSAVPLTALQFNALMGMPGNDGKLHFNGKDVSDGQTNILKDTKWTASKEAGNTSFFLLSGKESDDVKNPFMLMVDTATYATGYFKLTTDTLAVDGAANITALTTGGYNATTYLGGASASLPVVKTKFTRPIAAAQWQATYSFLNDSIALKVLNTPTLTSAGYTGDYITTGWEVYASGTTNTALTGGTWHGYDATTAVIAAVPALSKVNDLHTALFTWVVSALKNAAGRTADNADNSFAKTSFAAGLGSMVPAGTSGAVTGAELIALAEAEMAAATKPSAGVTDPQWKETKEFIESCKYGRRVVAEVTPQYYYQRGQMHLAASGATKTAALVKFSNLQVLSMATEAGSPLAITDANAEAPLIQPFASAPAGDADITSDTKLFFIQEKNVGHDASLRATTETNKYLVATGNAVAPFTALAEEVSNENPFAQWAFVPSASGSYQILNRATGYSLYSGMVSKVKDADGNVVADTYVVGADTLKLAAVDLSGASIYEEKVGSNKVKYDYTGYFYAGPQAGKTMSFEIAPVSPFMSSLAMQVQADSTVVLGEAENAPIWYFEEKAGEPYGLTISGMPRLKSVSYKVYMKDEDGTKYYIVAGTGATANKFIVTKETSAAGAAAKGLYFRTVAENTYLISDGLTGAAFKMTINPTPAQPIIEATGFTSMKNDYFTVGKSSVSHYRTLTAEDGVNGNAAIYLNNENSRYLYENTANIVANNGTKFAKDSLNFLGIFNAFELDKNPTVYVDTAYVDRAGNIMPQYMFALGVTDVPASAAIPCAEGGVHIDKDGKPTTADKCVHATPATKGYKAGRYLVVLTDSTDNKSAKYDGATRLAFVPAKHYLGEDSLVIDNSKWTGNSKQITAGNKTTYASKDTIKIENNTLKASTFALLIKDQADKSFYLETKGGYVRILNGVPVLTTSKDDAAIFNIEASELEATANEAIEAAGVQVIGGQGVVTVQGAAGKVITVANILGQTIANQVAASDNVTIAAPAGVVVVAVDGEATKVVVK